MYRSTPLIDAIAKGIWDERDLLEKEIAQDFSHYLWDSSSVENLTMPKQTLFNFGVAIGRLIELDASLHELDPRRFGLRSIPEIRSHLYSRLI